MIKLGFITNSMTGAGVSKIGDIARWAVKNGFQDLEIGPAVKLDEGEILKAKEETGIETNTLIYCRDFLSSNQRQADQCLNELQQRIEFAPRIGASQIVTTTGVSPDSYKNGNFHPEASLDAFERAFTPVIDRAEALGVDILFEICPFMGNVAISPYMWDIIFDRMKSDRLGIAYDPSHLVWQMIDPYELLRPYGQKIRHVHGKDCQIDRNTLKKTGILHMFNMASCDVKDKAVSKNLWWTYRLPGLGELNWKKIVSGLYDIGFEGTISMEHEDPVWSGTEEKVKLGLVASRKHIEQCLIS